MSEIMPDLILKSLYYIKSPKVLEHHAYHAEYHILRYKYYVFLYYLFQGSFLISYS